MAAGFIFHACFWSVATAVVALLVGCHKQPRCSQQVFVTANLALCVTECTINATRQQVGLGVGSYQNNSHLCVNTLASTRRKAMSKETVTNSQHITNRQHTAHTTQRADATPQANHDCNNNNHSP